MLAKLACTIYGLNLSKLLIYNIYILLLVSSHLSNIIFAKHTCTLITHIGDKLQALYYFSSSSSSIIFFEN